MGKAKENVDKTKVYMRDKFVFDSKGKRLGIVLDMKAYRKIKEDIEELDAIRAYDKAKAEKDEIIPFRQAIKEIEEKRK